MLISQEICIKNNINNINTVNLHRYMADGVIIIAYTCIQTYTITIIINNYNNNKYSTWGKKQTEGLKKVC